MNTTSEQIQKYSHSRHSTKLGRTIEQVDVLARLLLKVLASDFLAVFYARSGSSKMIPVAFHQWGDRSTENLDLLEKAFNIGEDRAVDPRRGVAYFGTSGAGAGDQTCAFATANGFQTRYLCPIYVDDELRGMIAAYWFDHKEEVGTGVSHLLNPLAELLVGWMTLIEEIQVSDGFSMRLSSLISLFDLPLDEYRMVDLVARMVKTVRIVMRGFTVTPLARDPFSGKYQVLDSDTGSSDLADETDKLVQVGAALLADLRRQDGHSRGWVDLSSAFDSEQLTVILTELFSDDRYHFAAIFTRDRADGYTEAELELISVFRMFSGTILANARVIRDLKKANERIREASSRLADTETMAALADMSSGIAHDLNNTVGSVVGRLQLLKLKCSDEKLAISLTKVEAAALEASDTVRRLQQFSSSVKVRGLLQLDLTTIVRAYLEKADQGWRDLSAQKRVTIIRDTNCPDATVSATVEDIEVILEKLLSNAVDFAPEGSSVQVNLAVTEKEVVLSVVDCGPGIPKDLQSKIFYPFFTTKSTRGAGLGLAIVYGVVARLGGKISVLSEPESGSLFRIAFPRDQVQTEISEITRKTPKAENLRILVVDDDDQIRDILSDMLQLDGHAATTCPDGFVAIRNLEAGPFDLLITDLGMPGMSGLELAGTAHEKYPSMPIAMITGWGTQLNEDEIALRGIQAVLPKPFHLKDVKALVHELAAPQSTSQ